MLTANIKRVYIRHMGRPNMGRTRYNFWLDDVDKAALDAIYQAGGATPSDQIRRAIKAYLEGQANAKADRKRAATRKRP